MSRSVKQNYFYLVAASIAEVRDSMTCQNRKKLPKAIFFSVNRSTSHAVLLILGDLILEFLRIDLIWPNMFIKSKLVSRN